MEGIMTRYHRKVTEGATKLNDSLMESELRKNCPFRCMNQRPNLRIAVMKITVQEKLLRSYLRYIYGTQIYSSDFEGDMELVP
jgi:hypothetical protein